MTLASLIERSQKNSEAWKYTSLAALAKVPYQSNIEGYGMLRASAKPLGKEQPHYLVFINGVWQKDQSQFADLPSGFIEGDTVHGYRLKLAGQTCLVTAPVELIFINAPEKQALEVTTKIHIELGCSGRLTLMERHESQSEHPVAHMVETTIELASQAKLVHGKIAGPFAAAHLATTEVSVAEGAYYDNFTLLCGGKLVRNEVNVTLSNELAQCVLNGVMLAQGDDHIDTTTCMKHAAPNCSSREVYKSVITDKARAVFKGKILVEKAAQKSDGHQLCRALLLSDQAEMDAKPELEIYADDVKCSHGCSVGDLDADALFYLRARGLSEAQARALLVRGFIDEIVDEIRVDDWRQYCRQRIEEWLNDCV